MVAAVSDEIISQLRSYNALSDLKSELTVVAKYLTAMGIFKGKSSEYVEMLLIEKARKQIG